MCQRFAGIVTQPDHLACIVGDGERLQHIIHLFRLEIELRGFAGTKPLLRKTEALDLTEIARGRIRLQVERRMAGDCYIGLIVGMKKYEAFSADHAALFAYTTIQEKATAIFYKCLAASVEDPLLKEIMAKLVADESRHAKAWGVEFAEPKIDLDKLREFKNNVVKRLTSGTGQLGKARKVNYIQGFAELLDANLAAAVA